MQAPDFNSSAPVAKEQRFVADMRERFQQYGKRIRISPKQWRVLEEIETHCCASR
jgi:hypothetical protein